MRVCIEKNRVEQNRLMGVGGCQGNQIFRLRYGKSYGMNMQ